MPVTLKKKSVAPAPDVVASDQIKVAFPDMESVKTSSLKYNPRNTRDHSEEQLAALVRSIQLWGWTIPAVVNEDNVVLAGHGRVEAARRAKLDEVTVVRVSGWDEFKQRAYMIADNQLALLSFWDWGTLASEVDFLQEQSFDLESLGLTSVSKASISAHKMANAPAPLPGTTGVPGSMAKKFGVVPFSVVSVGDPWWVQERAVWLSRGAVASDLCCLLDLFMRWFCPVGGGVCGFSNPDLRTVSSLLGSESGEDFAFIDLVSDEESLDHFGGVGSLLSPNRFCVVALPAFAPTGLWGKVLDVARASGLRYYNEMVVDGMGSGEGEPPARHVFVLVFIKGDERAAAEVVGSPNLVLLSPAEVDSVPVITDPHAITPILQEGDIWMKRDDYFAVGTARGGKVRSCLEVSKGASGLVTAGSRASPQVNIVAQVAKQLGIPARAHLPQGALSPCVQETVQDIELVQHKAGYNNVIVKRAKDDAAKSGWREVPFGMETEIAVVCTRAQVRGIPEEVERIIMPVGSGMSLAGVLWGLLDEGLDIPVTGVCVGADPASRLDVYAPPNWRDMVQLVKSDLDYHDPAPETIFRGVQLDPIYEAKVLPFLKPGDLFWVVGIRSVL